MRKTKTCKKCPASFVPLQDEDLCFDCHYNGQTNIHPETERHKKIIKGGREDEI